MNGVPIEAVWATRRQKFNGGALRNDEHLGAYRFVVAHEHDCGEGRCEVWVAYFQNYEAAQARLQEHQERGQNASIFAVLPVGFPE